MYQHSQRRRQRMADQPAGPSANHASVWAERVGILKAPDAEKKKLQGEGVGGEHGEGGVRWRADWYARGIDVETHPCSKLERVSMNSWIATTQLLHQNASNRTPIREAFVGEVKRNARQEYASVLEELFSNRFETHHNGRNCITSSCSAGSIPGSTSKATGDLEPCRAQAQCRNFKLSARCGG